MQSTSDILLVGSDGYIGSNCTIKNVERIDIKSGHDFLKLPIRECKTIIFLASATPGIQQTEEDYKYNESLYNRLDRWLREYPNIHVIFSSSAAVYGKTYEPSKESDYLIPNTTYGISKLAGEFRIREYNRHTILRFGNVYGKLGGQEGRGVTESFMHGGVHIFGNGKQIRDFVNIKLIWKVIADAVDHPVLWRGVTNVSTGIGVTINEWFSTWGTGKPQHLGKRRGDVAYSVLDNTKMKQRLERCVL